MQQQNSKTLMRRTVTEETSETAHEPVWETLMVITFHRTSRICVRIIKNIVCLPCILYMVLQSDRFVWPLFIGLKVVLEEMLILKHFKWDGMTPSDNAFWGWGEGSRAGVIRKNTIPSVCKDIKRKEKHPCDNQLQQWTVCFLINFPGLRQKRWYFQLPGTGWVLKQRRKI